MTRLRRQTVAIVGLILILVAAGTAVWLLRSHSGTANNNIVDVPKAQLPVGGRVIKLTPVAALTAGNVNTNSAGVYGTSGLEPAKSGIELYTLIYTTTDPRTNKAINVNARVYIPQTNQLATAIVYGPGTTGIASSCAPSKEHELLKNWGRYDEHLGFLAGQGYITASTDYDNRDQGGLQHYFVGEAEGRAMLDLARALIAIKSPAYIPKYSKPQQFVMSGYSQGGHAALWAEHLQSQYGADVKVAGVLGYAAATDVTKLVKDSTGGTTSVWLPPYVLAAYRDYYGITTQPSLMLNEPFATSFSEDTKRCIDQLETKTARYSAALTQPISVYQPAFVQAMQYGSIDSYAPEFAAKMTANLAGNWASAAPVLMIGGNLDAVVRPDSQTEMVKRLCAADTGSVQLQMYPTGTHYNTMALGRFASLQWLSQIVNGNKPTSQCESYR